MSHVDFKKWPYIPVEFKGKGPCYSQLYLTWEFKGPQNGHRPLTLIAVSLRDPRTASCSPTTVQFHYQFAPIYERIQAHLGNL